MKVATKIVQDERKAKHKNEFFVWLFARLFAVKKSILCFALADREFLAACVVAENVQPLGECDGCFTVNGQ